MQYFAGPEIPWRKFQIGDTVLDTDNKVIDMVTLSGGYAMPPDKNTTGFTIYKDSPLMGEHIKLYLTKEDIFTLYEYAKSKEGK